MQSHRQRDGGRVLLLSAALFPVAVLVFFHLATFLTWSVLLLAGYLAYRGWRKTTPWLEEDPERQRGEIEREQFRRIVESDDWDRT